MKKNRRQFIKTTALGTILSSRFVQGNQRFNPISTFTRKEVLPEPTEAQKAWMDLKFGMFIHFGINTYYDREWSDGDLDISIFNPTELDTDQWCEVAKKAGMNYLVLNCKHHDGFCLWNTRYTDYSVMHTPYKKDILEEVAKSAQKYGLKLGIYYSLWDSREKSHDEDEYAYVEWMKNQLHELLTQYGPIIELWLDGFWKKQQSGWKNPDGGFVTPENFIHSWRNEGAYRWQIDHVYQYIKKLQPNCIIMNNPTSKFKTTPLHPVDAVCAERGQDLTEYQKYWEWLGKKQFFPLQIETTMSTKGNEKFPKGNWFWHEWDHSVASKEDILRWLKNAENLNANLLLNCGPMSNGRLRPEDVETLSNLKT